ncbi:MAG: XTP/dITP diphosphatase [Ruminococcaceae bacterium]|nr:XTP/dITP diphosphatase [Oscillospiraceae bacterium]
MIKIVLATNNAHKVSEFKGCFNQKGIDIEIVTLKEIGFCGDIIEDADSFEGNAYIKAKAICDYTGEIAVADDSGLVVDALNGAPGVYSARYAGENSSDSDNIEKLLNELDKLGEVPRTAKFVCCICAVRPDGEKLFVRGESAGEILKELKGEGGFGYDPVFFCPDFGKTFAQLTSEEKNSISHRGRAIEKLAENLDFFKA